MNRRRTIKLPCTFAIVALLAAVPPASAAREPVALRPRSIGEAGSRVDGAIESMSAAGLTVRQGEGPAARRVVIGLDRLPLPFDAPVADAAARANAGDLATLAMTTWRARTRLERGDWAGAEPLFEAAAAQAGTLSGPTGATIAHGLLMCRAVREARAGAVWAWLSWTRTIRSGPGLAESPAGSLVAPPAATTVAWVGGRIEPMVGRSPVDPRTGLAPALPPVWVPIPSLEAMVRSPEWERLGLAENDPVAELAQWYRAAATFESGGTPVVPPATSAEDAVRLVREVVVSRIGEPDARAQARGGLSARLGGEGVDRWIEAWCRTAIGRSLVREADAREVRRGVLELLHVPARFNADQPYLSGVALASAAVAMSDLGDAGAARVLRAEFDAHYPAHPASAWAQLRQIGGAAGGSPSGGPIGAVIGAAVIGMQPERAPLPEPIEGEIAGPDDALEAYLRRLGLTGLLAQQLEQRVATLGRDRRGPVAERLARLYVHLLEAAATAEERADWEARANALLRDVPEADGHELRISLARVLYVRAEEACERGRLKLATAEELAEAERVLRQLEPQFREIASKVHRRAENLERIENQGDGTDELSRQLSDARRVRSLAFYYAGWCNYYLAMLTRAEPHAGDALKSFGWLLNSPNGRAATLDRLPTAMLRYEHVARAAMGCGLALSLRGSDSEALRWLETVDESAELAPSVRSQLLNRQIAVLAQAKRWSDLERVIRRARNSDRAGGGPDVRPLEVFDARLLAVVALEADARISGPLLEQLARIALGDLVARGQIAHVLDLTSQFGTAPIGESGFIVHYVRGIKAYDEAREAHKAAGGNPDEPVSAESLVNLYRAAASLLQAALHQDDSDQYRPERARAALYGGRGLFFAGDLPGAADLFQKSWEFYTGLDAHASDAEEALWLSVVALDRAAARPGAPAELAARRSQAGAVFLQSFPDSPRAARLLLMRAAAGEVGDDEALRVLEAVPKDAPMFEPARRQIARILYARFRAASGTERDFAALRFITVAEELLALDRRAATTNPPSDPAAAGRAVLRARQLLDALLGVTNPDADRALSTLELLRTLARLTGQDIAEHEAELVFRELQIAIIRGRDTDAELLAERLAALPAARTEYLPAAERLVYRRAADQFRSARSPDSRIEAAQRVVMHGVKIIDRLIPGADRSADAASTVLQSTVAAAAFALWESSQSDPSAPGNEEMRDLSMRLDRAVLKASPRHEESLRRLAVTADATGDHRAALECWSVLLAAAASGSEAWFEARYHALRLLVKLEPARARDLLAQHKLLFPDYGPAPWGARIRELEAGPGATTPVNGGTP